MKLIFGYFVQRAHTDFGISGQLNRSYMCVVFPLRHSTSGPHEITSSIPNIQCVHLYPTLQDASLFGLHFFSLYYLFTLDLPFLLCVNIIVKSYSTVWFTLFTAVRLSSVHNLTLLFGVCDSVRGRAIFISCLRHK